MLIWDLASRLQSDIEWILAEQDITFVEFRVLAVCLERQECAATEISATAPIEVSSVSRIVQRLFQKGLVQRRRSVEDRRVVWLQPTPEGRKLMNSIERRMEEFDREMAERAGRERVEALSAAMVEALELLPSPPDAE